jgi:hypothetical protein
MKFFIGVEEGVDVVFSGCAGVDVDEALNLCRVHLVEK